MPVLHCVLLIRVFWQDALADALYSCFSAVELVFGVSIGDIKFCIGRPKSGISVKQCTSLIVVPLRTGSQQFFAAKRGTVSVSFKKLVVT